MLYHELRQAELAAIECFPTASRTRWGGSRGKRRRSEWTQAILRRIALLNVPATLSQDNRDAIAAALTARDHDAGKTERFGDIVVPKAHDRTVEAPSNVGRGSEGRPFVVQGAQEITSVGDWFAVAPPKKGATQWRPGRSALESARAWLRQGKPAIPAEITALLDTRPETRNFEAILAQPEVVTRLDDFRGDTVITT
jgi:hypothetical protein